MLRIRRGDIVVEADGDEARSLALLVLGIEPKANEGTAATPMSERAQKLGKFIEAVRGRPTARVLYQIARLGGTVSDSDLVKAMGVAGNMQIAGSLGGIAKNAKRVELRAEDVLARSKRRTHDGAVYTYSLPHDLRDLILRELASEGETAVTLPTG